MHWEVINVRSDDSTTCIKAMGSWVALWKKQDFFVEFAIP